MTKMETEAVVNGFMTTVIQALAEGDTVEIRGFGTFKVQYRAARSAHNPRTNKLMTLSERYVPVFKPSRSFRAVVDQAAKSND